MVDRSPIHPDPLGIVEVQELLTYELGAIVSYNAIGNFEPVDDVLDEFSCPLRLEVGDGPDFDPLGEFVDGD